MINHFNSIQSKLSVPFPLFSQQSFINFTPENLTADIGTLSNSLNLHTFIKYEIQGDKLFLDAPALTYPESYFKRDFEIFRHGYEASFKDYAFQFAEISRQTLDLAHLEIAVQNVVAFEKKRD